MSVILEPGSFVSFMVQVRIRSKQIRWTFRLEQENLSQLLESQVQVKAHYHMLGGLDTPDKAGRALAGKIYTG